MAVTDRLGRLATGRSTRARAASVLGMSLNCDITVVPGRRVADLIAAGAVDLGPTTLDEGISGMGAAAAEVGSSLVLFSALELAGVATDLFAALGAPVYQAVIGETGDGFALMAVTGAGERTRAFNAGVEVTSEGTPLAVEGDLPPLDTDALLDVLARVEPALRLDDALLDAPATGVDVTALTGI